MIDVFDDVFDIVDNILNHKCDRDIDITLQGIDSILLVELIIQLEKRFNIELTADDLELERVITPTSLKESIVKKCLNLKQK